MDLFREDYLPIEFSEALHQEETPVTAASDREANLTNIREKVINLIDLSMSEYEKQLNEALENMKESFRADLSLREQARDDEVEGRKDRIRKGTLELDGWLTSWVTKWFSKTKKPSDDVPEDHRVNGKMHRGMKHDLRTTLGLMEFRNQKDMYMRHMKACDDEDIFKKNTSENMEALESAYKNMTADISKRLDEMWASFNVPKLHQNEVHPDTSGGPLEETTAPPISSTPSESAVTPRESKEGLDALSKPQEDFKRVKRRPQIVIRLPKKSRKLKLKARDKAVMPIVERHNCGADGIVEVQAEKEQAERKLQERIKMFEVKSEEGRKVEAKGEERKARKTWRRIFWWLLP